MGKTVLGPLQKHTKLVWSVAFLPDGRHIVSGSRDGMIQMWDAGTGKTVVGPLQADEHGVFSIAFLPDSTRVVLGGGDNLVKTWDAKIYRVLASCSIS
jgi:WD40 repeat protein